MNRRPLTAIALGAAALLALSACAQSANNNNAPSSDAAPAANLTVAFETGGVTLDPLKASDVTSDTIIQNTYDQLVQYGVKDGAASTDDIQPMLAESWEVSADELTYTLKLRDDVKFASGNKLTSADVVWTLDRIAKDEGTSFYYDLNNIAEVTAPDETTAVIKLSKPSSLLLQTLAQYNFSIIDSATVEANGADSLATTPAGSGPYSLSNWDASVSAVLEGRSDYWNGAPKVSKVTMSFISDASNRAQLVKSGDADIAVAIDPKDAAQVGETDGVTINSTASGQVEYLALDMDDPILSKEKVRQALAYAVPSKSIISQVLFDQGSEMRSSIPSTMPGYTDEGYSYDENLDKAKELLKEAGHADGFTFKVALQDGNSTEIAAATLLQANLAEIGVNMETTTLAATQFAAQMQSGDVSYVTGWTSFINDPGYHLGLLLQSDGVANYGGYQNTEVDADIAKAIASNDQAVKDAAYKDAQTKINTEVPQLYLFEVNRIVAVNDDVDGYVFYPNLLIHFDQLSK